LKWTDFDDRSATVQISFHGRVERAQPYRTVRRLLFTFAGRERMKTSLLVGVVLLVFGITTALMGIFSVGEQVFGSTEATTQFPIGGPLWYVGVPIVSGLALGFGALFIGLSMGNWRRPRSHSEPGDEAVNPEGHHKMKHV